MHATVILPVKRFGAAKQRLTDALEPQHRLTLAAAMLGDVLAAISRAALVERVLVVSGDPRAIAIAQEAGASVIDDADDAGHSQAAMIGVAAALEAGCRCVALLPGDCPALDPAELDAALEAVEDGTVGVIPDRHGTGTNGLILAPPDAIEPAFGPGSRARHLALAAAADREGTVVELGSLGLDLDTREDLTALRQWLKTAPDRCAATTAALALIDQPLRSEP